MWKDSAQSSAAAVECTSSPSYLGVGSIRTFSAQEFKTTRSIARDLTSELIKGR